MVWLGGFTHCPPSIGNAGLSSGAERQKVRYRGSHGNVGHGDLAQGEQEAFLTITYARKDVVQEITRAGGGLTGKATNVVHSLMPLLHSPEQSRCRSWKAPFAFWLYTPIMDRFANPVNYN